MKCDHRSLEWVGYQVYPNPVRALRVLGAKHCALFHCYECDAFLFGLQGVTWTRKQVIKYFPNTTIFPNVSKRKKHGKV